MTMLKPIKEKDICKRGKRNELNLKRNTFIVLTSLVDVLVLNRKSLNCDIVIFLLK